MAAEPAPREDPRAELRDAPPLLTWRKLYVLVLGTLAVEIAFFALLTWAYR